MSLHFHRLRSHVLSDLSQESRHVLHVLRAGGRGLRVLVPAKWICLWLPLSGEIEMQAAECQWLLRQGDLMIWRDGSLRASSHGAGWWLAVCGSPSAWARYLRPRPGEPAMETFPWEGRCPRELRRSIVRLARLAADPEGNSMRIEHTADMLRAALAEHQAIFHPLVARSAGRTLQRRQQTLLRMLRVRQFVQRHENGLPNLAGLAANAGYSPYYLNRCFGVVFGETPMEYAIRLRLERAWRLVRETRMSISEITYLLGFESQSAFCRAFKKAYGMTTSQVRLQDRNERFAAA